MIDADELLKAYDEAHEGAPGKARKLIEDAPTVSGWISVNDRLPSLKRTDEVDFNGEQMDFKTSEEVLIFTPVGIDIGLLEDDGQGIFWTAGGCNCSVSYWMPIPKPPKQ